MDSAELRVLLIEDDEDDYVLVRGLLSEIPTVKYKLDWVATYEAAGEEIAKCRHDVYLLDYRLGGRSGLDLLTTPSAHECKAPIIFLTGQGNYEIDIQAMQAGAADYLVKGQINSHLLERSIRYAIEHTRVERRLKQLSAKLLAAQEEERNRIARELHDSIGSCLTAVKFGIQNALGFLETDSAAAESLRSLVSTTQTAIDEVRKIITDLRPSILDDLGIVITVGWFCRQFRSVYSNIRVSETVDVEEQDVPEDLKIVMFRIMQEAFHNVVKYSKADCVGISLCKTSRTIELTIEDNGVGFDPNELPTRRTDGGGLGLTSMRERTELSGGSFSIHSSLGAGTVIRASWGRT